MLICANRFPFLNKLGGKKMLKLVSTPLILWFCLLPVVGPLRLMTTVMRLQGLQIFSSQGHKVKNMKGILIQSLLWTVSLWITAERSGAYRRLAAVMGTDWYLKWPWNRACVIQTDGQHFRWMCAWTVLVVTPQLNFSEGVWETYNWLKSRPESLAY